MKTTHVLPFLSPLALALPSALPLADVSAEAYSSFSRMEVEARDFDPNSRPFSFLRSRALGDATQNDVKNGVCKQMTVLFARGTTEGGNMGSLAGPPFVQAVGQMVGADNLAVQGIDYPADIPGFLAGGDAGGSQLMAQMVGQVMAACPTTSLVMAGYRSVSRSLERKLRTDERAQPRRSACPQRRGHASCRSVCLCEIGCHFRRPKQRRRCWQRSGGEHKGYLP